MPDRYGFDHLGELRGLPEVRCAEEGCSIGGRLHLWPVRLRAAHQRMHDREARRESAKAAKARQREATRRLQTANRLRREAREASLR